MALQPFFQKELLPKNLQNTLSSNDEGYCFFDTTLGKPIYFKIINNVKVWVEEDGARAGVRRIGMTEQRPSETDIYIGFQYYDTTLGKVVVWNESLGVTNDNGQGCDLCPLKR